MAACENLNDDCLSTSTGNQSGSWNNVSTVVPKARASRSASTVEGMKTPFSTVLMVLRDTPTIAASSACVRFSLARSSRRRFTSCSAIAVSTNLENGKGEEREAGTRADEGVHRDARRSLTKPRGEIDRERRGHRDPVSHG